MRARQRVAGFQIGLQARHDARPAAGHRLDELGAILVDRMGDGELHDVAILREGREKLHFLNPVPINDIAERWIGKYERGRLKALSDLKRNLEREDK